MLGAGRNHITKGSETSGEYCFVVTELAQNGELFEYLTAADFLTPEITRAFFF